MLWKCRHSSNIPLLCLWPPIHWFINSVMVVINPLDLLTPFSKKEMVTSFKSVNPPTHFCSIKLCFPLVRRKNKGIRQTGGLHVIRPPFWFFPSGTWVRGEALSQCEWLVITAPSLLGCSDSLLMDSAPVLRQTPVGPRIERARPALSFHISVIISLLMLCLHSVSPQASPKHPTTTTTTHTYTQKHIL